MHLLSTSAALLGCLLAALPVLPGGESAPELATGGRANTANLPCGQDEQSSWEQIRLLVRDQVLRLTARMPFVLFKHDLNTLDWIQAELKKLGVEDEDVSYAALPETWSQCSVGLLTVRVLFVLMRVPPAQTPYAGAQVLQAVMSAPWVEVMLSGWPIFTALAALMRWASPHADQQVAHFSGSQAQEALKAAREFPESGCDVAEIGASPAARHLLSRAWRSQDPAVISGAEPGSLEELVEGMLGDAEGGDGGAHWGGQAGGCRWTEHADRYLGGLVDGSGVHRELLPAMAACSAASSCAGLTIVREQVAEEDGSMGWGLSITLRKGEPLLQASPAGEASVVRWCPAKIHGEGIPADVPPCPGGRVVGLLSTALRRLGSGSMGDFSPELVVEAQALIATWALKLGSPLAQAEMWGTEWPVWSILGQLQSRTDFLQSPASASSSDSGGEVRPPPWALALQQTLGFSDDAFRLATEELMRLAKPNSADSKGVPKGLRERVHCASSSQCAGELFARLQLLLYDSGAMPLRDPIFIDPQDNLASLFMERSRALLGGVDYDWGGMVQEEVERRRQKGEKVRSDELDRLMPANHPLQVDRRQLANFILEVREIATEKQPLGRCLEWDQPFLLVRAFQGVCRWTDVFSYSEPSPDEPMMGMPGRHEYPHGTRHYWGDLERPEGPGIEPDTFDLIVCPFVFEHIALPFLAMENLAKLLKPGGHIIWAAPFIQQYHGSPHDYYRYTPNGAKALAKSAGLEVIKLYAPGDLAVATGVLTGMLLPYWDEARALQEQPTAPDEDSPRTPLNIFALLKRPEKPNVTEND